MLLLCSRAYRTPYFLAHQVFYGLPQPGFTLPNLLSLPLAVQPAECYTHTHRGPSSLCVCLPHPEPLSLPVLQAPPPRTLPDNSSPHYHSLLSSCFDEHTIFNTRLLSAYCMPGTVLGAGGIEVNCMGLEVVRALGPWALPMVTGTNTTHNLPRCSPNMLSPLLPTCPQHSPLWAG